MLFKLGLKIGILGLEIFLAFYSIIVSDSLLVKFCFFAFSAIIIAFIVAKMTNKILPSDKEYTSGERDREGLRS